MSHKLPESFYLQDTIEVARQLLGKKLVHVCDDGTMLSGLIVETEAYLGIHDPAAHVFGDRKTERTQAMYMQGGHAYIYFIYGMYFCLNVVTQKEGTPEAVLIRAIEPLEGIDRMKRNRKIIDHRRERQLTNGPGKLCQAMELDLSLNRIALNSDRLYLLEGEDFEPFIEEDVRVGIDYAGDAVHWPLRFYVKDNPFVSRIRKDSDLN